MPASATSLGDAASPTPVTVTVVEVTTGIGCTSNESSVVDASNNGVAVGSVAAVASAIVGAAVFGAIVGVGTALLVSAALVEVGSAAAVVCVVTARYCVCDKTIILLFAMINL